MTDRTPPAQVGPVAVRDPQVLELLDELTRELASGGYTDAETFGYSADELERAGVHLVGVRVGARLVGVGGVRTGGRPRRLGRAVSRVGEHQNLAASPMGAARMVGEQK